MSLICFGTVALDNIKTPSGLRTNLLGGSASHFSMSARLFTKIYLASIIGEDFPKKHIQFFKNKGVDISSITIDHGKTFAWKGEYDQKDFNSAITLSTELGVLEGYVPQVKEEHRTISNVFLANFDPDNQAQFLQLMKSPKFVGMDTMNLWINIKKKSVLSLMKKVDLFVANDGEAKAITGEVNLIKAAKALRKYGPKLVVVKKGEHGVIFYSDDFMFSFSAYPVEKVVDPTGAGDTFAGGLMGYLSKAGKVNEKVLRQAAIYATTLSSFNVEGFGVAKTAPLTLTEVNKRMKRLVKFIKP